MRAVLVLRAYPNATHDSVEAHVDALEASGQLVSKQQTGGVPLEDIRRMTIERCREFLTRRAERAAAGG